MRVIISQFLAPETIHFFGGLLFFSIFSAIYFNVPEKIRSKKTAMFFCSLVLSFITIFFSKEAFFPEEKSVWPGLSCSVFVFFYFFIFPIVGWRVFKFRLAEALSIALMVFLEASYYYKNFYYKYPAKILFLIFSAVAVFLLLFFLIKIMREKIHESS